MSNVSLTKQTSNKLHFQDFTISQNDIIVHEDFKKIRGNIQNDIALVRLPGKVTRTMLAQFACLPLPANSSLAGLDNWGEATVGREPTVVGWGHSCYEEGTRTLCQEDKSIPTKTQQKLKVCIARFTNLPSYVYYFIMKVAVQSSSKCTDKGFKIDERQICAGGAAGEGSCRGDSGGGLFINAQPLNEEIQPWYLFGIVSFGGSNCQAELPEVYVR